MVSEEQVLLLDVGNTRIKSLRLNKLHSDEPRFHHSIEALFSYLSGETSVKYLYISNVGSESLAQEIRTFCELHSLTYRFVFTEKQNFGVKNSYQDVTKMGVDRWLAMVAGEKLTKRAFCVIDVGTAITCDFVISGQHLGGWISPGFRMMRESLVENTARVTADNYIPHQSAVGTNTEKCVAFGCLAAVNGVYLSAIDYLASKQVEFDVIIGGGDKNMLALNKFSDSILVANLVVHGLARYARSELFA